MKRILFTIFLISSLILTSCAATKETSTKETGKTVIQAATWGSPKPFTFVNDKNELTGHNIELLKEVFKKLPQYELKIEITDFPSIFAGLDSGRYQIGVNNLAKNTERKEKYLFSDAIFFNEYVAIFKGDNKTADTIKTWADLGGLTTITNTGLNITTGLENYNKSNPSNPIKISYTDADFTVQLQHIEDGKNDFMLMDKPMFEYYQREYNFKVKGVDIGNDISKDLLDEPYSYFLLSKGNEKLLEDINKALKEVIAEGTSKAINEKWFGRDYTPNNNK